MKACFIVLTLNEDIKITQSDNDLFDQTPATEATVFVSARDF